MSVDVTSDNSRRGDAPDNAPADGAKVWTTVSIYDHGKLHWSKRYYSNYPAVKGVLIVGTKQS